MKRVTRARPKVDRVACHRLVRRFVDPHAEFLYVPADHVAAVAERFRMVYRAARARATGLRRARRLLSGAPRCLVVRPPRARALASGLGLVGLVALPSAIAVPLELPPGVAVQAVRLRAGRRR